MAPYTKLCLIATLALGAFALVPNAAASECVQSNGQEVCVVEESDFGGDCQQYGYSNQCYSYSSEQLGASAQTDAGSVALYRQESDTGNSYDYNDGCTTQGYDSENHQDLVILDADLTAVGASVDGAVGRQGSSGTNDYANCGGYLSGSEGTYEWVGGSLVVDSADADAYVQVVSQEQAGSYWWQDPNGSGASAYCVADQYAAAVLYTTGPLGNAYEVTQHNAPC